jgi:general secretion pathway protein B
MSYILDALRRAEAERERGIVPGLHSQPLPAALADGERASKLPSWAIGAAVLAVGAAGAWWWTRPASAPAPVVVAPVVMPVPPASPVPSPSPAPLPVAVAVPAPAVVVAPPAPVVVAAPPPAPVATPAPAPMAAVAETPPPAASAPVAVIAFELLPDDVRRQLPAVQIGGAIYSDNAASRMLIVAGQLLREGDPVAPGVTLDTIKPRSAVMRWKGLRYEMSF